MSDLISRAAAIAEIEEYIEEYSELEPETGYHNLKWCAMEEAKDVLSMLPAVSAATVVHGRWQIRESGPGEIECKCSVCKYRDFVPRNDMYWVNRKFCPNCGAKMDGERRESE